MQTIDQIDVLSPTVIRAWYDDKTALSYTLHDTLPDSVDVLIPSLLMIIAEQPAEQPLFVLVDLSSRYAPLSGYMRTRLDDVADHLRQRALSLVLAVVLPNDLISQVPVIYSRFFVRRAGQVQFKFFLRRDPALEWLSCSKAQIDSARVANG